MFKRGLEFQFDLLYRTKEAHSRIVWALSWSHDDTLYATASRENKKSVKSLHTWFKKELRKPAQDYGEYNVSITSYDPTTDSGLGFEFSTEAQKPID